jgi:hypothetical protein
MFKFKHHESKADAFTGGFDLQKMKEKMNKGRRRRRSVPRSHPWRQYKLTQCAGK